MSIELDPQPVPGSKTVEVDELWFRAAMRIAVRPYEFCPRCEMTKPTGRLALAESRLRELGEGPPPLKGDAA